MLYPYALQRELADALPNAELYTIDSPHGHDSFLIEIKQLNDVMAKWRRGESVETRIDASDFTTLESSEDVHELREGVKRLREELTVAELKRERAEAALRAALDPSQNTSTTNGLHAPPPSAAPSRFRLVRPMNPSGSDTLVPVFGELSVDDESAPSTFAAF